MPGVIASATVDASVVTTLPSASTTSTAGWVRSAVPPVDPAGWVPKASAVAAPGATLNVVEPVTDGAAARTTPRVVVAASVGVKAPDVATPPTKLSVLEG